MDESVEIDFDIFSKMISKYNSDENHFIGHSLISHGDQDVQYPDLRSGFILSRQLLMQIMSEWEENRNLLKEYTWDAPYQFAKVISYLDSNPRLIHEPLLCTSFKPGWFQFNKTVVSACKLHIQMFYFKTISMNHEKTLVHIDI